MAQCFVQVVKSTPNTAGTSVTISLAAAGSADNRPFLAVAHAANEATTPRASWTEIGDTQDIAPNRGTETQWRSDTFETTASATWTTSERYGAMAFEIKALGGAAPVYGGRSLRYARILRRIDAGPRLPAPARDRRGRAGRHGPPDTHRLDRRSGWLLGDTDEVDPGRHRRSSATRAGATSRPGSARSPSDGDASTSSTGSRPARRRCC